jgi:hypothetical protein
VLDCRQGNNAECVKYLDAALYNLKNKATDIVLGEEVRDRVVRKRLKQKLTIASKMLKLRFQSKLYLQLCAMLSQVDEYGL